LSSNYRNLTTVNTLVHREIPQSWIFVDYGKDNNLTYPSGKILKLFCKIMRSMSIHASKPKIELSQYFHRVGKLRFKKSPKSTFNCSIVEISSTFIRKH
jgi:hypothetical protein